MPAPNRSRRDSEGRPRRQPRKGGGGVIVLAVLLVVGAGVVVGMWDQIQAKIAQFQAPAEQEPQLKAPDLPQNKPPVEVQKPVELPPVEQPAVAVSEPEPTAPAPAHSDTRRAQSLMTRAENALGELRYDDNEFASALSLYEEVQSLDAPSDLKDQARRRSTQLRELQDLLREAKPAAHADGNLCRLHMRNGRKLVGAVEERGQQVWVQMKNIRAPISMGEIRRIERLEGNERRAELMKEYEQRVKKYPADTAAGQFLRGREAWSLRLGEVAVQSLLDAADKASGNLRQRVEEHQAQRLLDYALWRSTIGQDVEARVKCREIIREFGHTNKADDARDLLAMLDSRRSQSSYRSTVQVKEEKPEPAQPAVAAATSSQPSTAPGLDLMQPKPEPDEIEPVEVAAVQVQGSQNVARANKLFNEAMSLYQKGIHTQGRARNTYLKKAVAKFDQCIALYEQEKRANPGDTTLESRLTDANMGRYGALKSQTL